MPISISDRKLASLYASFEKQKRTNPGLTLGRDQAMQILAEVGDKAGSSSSQVLTAMKKPGLTMEQQVAIAKKGMSAGEKKDIETILDKGSVPLDPQAKAFLNAVVGRGTTPTPTPGPTPGPTPNPNVTTSGLTVTGDQHDGGISGVTKAGATIEAINISAAPGGRLHMDDTMVVGKADAAGKFSMAHLTGDQALKEGDQVRMRARYADGTTSDWVTIKAHGVEAKDTRNAVVALFRVGLTDKGTGKIDVANINEGRQVSEPGAKLQFTNSRTGEKTQVTITDVGGFPAGFQLNGKAGDSFSVAASDGVNNTAFTTAVGNVTVPGGAPATGDLIPDPKLHKDELNSDGTPKFTTKRFNGPLFADGIKAEDVQQGQLGDCYFPAAMAAIAKANPDAIQNLIKDNGDGTYTVNFKQKDWATGKFKDVAVKVDGDLYVRPWGGPLYGRSANSAEPTKMEMWFPLVEKAYAQWKGSYNDIGSGGMSSDVYEAVLGRTGNDMYLSNNKEAAWNQIKKSVDAHTPVGAGTFGEDQEAKYTNTGVYADHAYSILGYEQAGTERYVVLRNPWGESEPAGNGANDGIFKLKLDDFAKLYQNVMYVD